MMKRLTSNKGAVPVVVVVILVAAVAAAVLLIGLLSDGFGFGSGDGTGSGNVSAVQSEPPESEPIVEKLDFLDVTVSANDYLYQNSKLELDELIQKLVIDAADTKVKVTDENASKRAYKDLINALEDEHIRYIKADALN